MNFSTTVRSKINVRSASALEPKLISPEMIKVDDFIINNEFQKREIWDVVKLGWQRATVTGSIHTIAKSQRRHGAAFAVRVVLAQRNMLMSSLRVNFPIMSLVCRLAI